MDALLTAFARHLGLPPEAARPAFEGLLDALREALYAEGASTLEGIGRFYRSDGAVTFEPDPALVAAVNAPFAGLPPVTPAAPPPPPVEEETAPAEEDPAAEEYPAAALFSVPLEPTAAVEDDDELAAPALDVPEQEEARPLSDGAADAPIAPIPTAPTVTSAEAEGPEAPEEEDAFAAPDEAPAAPSPEPPLRDLSSDEEGEPPEEGEGAPPDTPIAVPFVPADELDEPPPAEAAPEEEAAALDDLDALLAGVWAPSSPPGPDHPLGPASEPVIEDAEYDLVGAPAAPEAEAEPAPASPAVPAVPLDEATPEAGAPPEGEADRRPAVPPLPPASEPGRPPPARPPREAAPAARPAPARRRQRGLALWLPLLAALVVLALVVLLWPRIGGEGTDEAVVAPAEPPAPAAARPDTAARAEADEDTALAPTPPGVAAEDQEETAPAETVPPAAEAAPPAPEPERPAPEPEPAPSAGIPAPLRGPGGVDPARGGATWVLGSGSRAGAERDAAHYRRQGYRADVLTGTSGGRTVHRVVVGQFASFDEAQRYRSALPPGAPSGAWVLRLE